MLLGEMIRAGETRLDENLISLTLNPWGLLEFGIDIIDPVKSEICLQISKL